MKIIKPKINTFFFSPTGTTKKIVTVIADELAENFDVLKSINNIDFTLPNARNNTVKFNKDDIVIVGVPVYAGRVPNVLLKYLNSINGNGALAIAVVLYGNRNYDDALIELNDILELTGFKVVAAGAFIGEHSFSEILAKDRPDESDLAVAIDFAKQIYSKITDAEEIQLIEINGNKPYRDYYKPKDKNGTPVDIRKVIPKTNSNCINCKLCFSICPMGSIDYEDVSLLNGICIKCGACIKKCPVQAKYYDDENYLKHKHELEIEFAGMKKDIVQLIK